MAEREAQRTDLVQLVRSELHARDDSEMGDTDVAFLGAGEYTYNFIVSRGDSRSVVRLITGSQMGLDRRSQAAYEGSALRLLGPSSRTPRLHGEVLNPSVVPYPYLILEYLPGGPLDYLADIPEAARCVADIHRLPVPERHGLQVHANPAASVQQEMTELAESLSPDVRRDLEPLLNRFAETAPDSDGGLFDDLRIINTDLNSHNFIVCDGYARLIDWEKARIGPSQLDIAHFLLPTTTLWRNQTATRLNADQRSAFVQTYLDARPDLRPERYLPGLRKAMQAAAVRAVVWCAWSIAATSSGDREISHEESLDRCRVFTSPAFIERLIDEVWDQADSYL